MRATTRSPDTALSTTAQLSVAYRSIPTINGAELCRRHGTPTTADAGMDLMYCTYSAYDLGYAISHRVLENMREEHSVERAATAHQHLKDRLNDQLSDHPNVIGIRGRRLLLGIALVRDRDEPAPFPRPVDFAKRVVGEAIDRGVWVYLAGSGPVADALLLGPPFTIEDEHIKLLVDVVADSITAATNSA